MNDLILPISGSQSDTYDEIYREFLGKRILVFNEEVDDSMVENIVMYILKWNMDDVDIPVEKRKPIKILFSSVGGDTFVAQNVADVILQSKTPIIGVGLSLVASACYHIFLACHERVGFKNTIYLQHDGTISISNSSKKARDTMNFFENMENENKKFVLDRTKMTGEFYDSIFEQEYYMYSTEAKELGVVDKIIGIDCTLDEVLA
jgi:ATP-dependent Clp protease protease subunit